MTLQLRGLPYPVLIARSAERQVVAAVKERSRRCVLVADAHVRERADRLAQYLKAAHVEVLDCVNLRGGEPYKRMSSMTALHKRLMNCGADRQTLLIAMGGGTITDVAGFAAATYMRGIPWLVVPTTVLGMVDASIGGKTGVDMPWGKNMVGAFWDPQAVFIDPTFIHALPIAHRRTGLAEIVKVAIISDAGLLDALERFDVRSRAERWVPIIETAVKLKISAVRADPRDQGARAALNLGHTIAHGIEYAGGYRVLHGHAVAVGLRGAGLLALARGWWSAPAHSRLLRLLRSQRLPVFAPHVSTRRIMAGIKRDKKRRDGMHQFILPVSVGEVRTGVEVSDAELRAVLDVCRKEPPAAEMAGC